jgi:hypothetical protein
MKYLLPCSCGQSVAIEVSQAGDRVRCACGNTLDVPAMRLIRQLPPAAADAPQKQRLRDRSWSLVQRLIFAAGLLLAVGGLGTAAFYQFWRTRLITDETPWDNLEQAHQDIDQMGVEKAWELWLLVRTDNIGPYSPPGFVRGRHASDTWYKVIVGALSTAGVGAFLAACALVVGPRAKPPAAKKKAGKGRGR